MARRPPARALAAAALAALALGVAGCSDDDCGEIDEGWLTYITHRDNQYDVRLARADGACDLALVRGSGPDLYPSISLARRLLVTWVTDQDGVGRIAVRSILPDPGRRVLVLDLGELVAEEPEVSPDGTRIAFRGRTPPATNGDLYVVATTGGTPQVLAAAPEDDATPTWSADGQTIFFTSNRSGRYQIWRVGLDGSGLAQVTTDETSILTCGAVACAVQGKAAASPDGTRIAFTRGTPAQQGTVVIRDLETGAERILADGVACAEPSWSASGRELAMFDLSWGDAEVIVRDAETGAYLHRITDSPGIDGAPSFAR